MQEIKSALGMGQGEDTGIFGTLKNEHRQVKQNLQQILNENRQLMDVYTQTIDALSMHLAGEERLIYPKLEDNASTRRMALQSYEEHNIAKQLISDMSSVSTDTERWLAKVRVLNDVVSHHIDVEENQVFPRAKEILSIEQQSQLKQQYLSTKEIPM